MPTWPLPVPALKGQDLQLFLVSLHVKSLERVRLVQLARGLVFLCIMGPRLAQLTVDGGPGFRGPDVATWPLFFNQGCGRGDFKGLWAG